ncbi:DUF4168 domain-containing protein [Salinisphaera sp. LB1]|uniref:DUF4168 domain-containing protein n=1 Tax=Salinisphaera sp. LB1 TaxID=2183911 RepID=UPI000D7D47DF|nr:DUF4168 domain-containing protein [Salinisphaera sp. LB1]AWN17347.1 hypothetical protein SALB1_3153 [Salinisphaera sp. LB1]
MKTITIRAILVCALAAAGVVSLSAIAAGGAEASAGDNAKTQPADRFSDKQLKQFVKAQSNVQAVLKKWDGKVASAKDRKAARKQENKAMVKAVKESGLTPKQYNAIAEQAQKDPKLTRRIQSFMTPQ